MSRHRHKEHEERKRGGRAKDGEFEKKKRARGGKTKYEHAAGRDTDAGQSTGEAAGDEYNAKGSPMAREAVEKTDGFKRGGHKKARKRGGGHADGKKPHHRADKPRRARGGKTPLSSAATVKTRPGMDESVKVDKSDD